MLQGKGALYEEKAYRFLNEKGLKLVERNYRCRLGEIDLIMRDAETLVFVEVKYRQSASHGLATETVTANKQKKISRTASHYLTCQNLWHLNSRFDVLAIQGAGRAKEDIHIEWLRNAFELQIPIL